MATGPRYDPVRKEYGALASKYDRKWAGYVEAAIRALASAGRLLARAAARRKSRL